MLHDEKVLQQIFPDLAASPQHRAVRLCLTVSAHVMKSGEAESRRKTNVESPPESHRLSALSGGRAAKCRRCGCALKYDSTLQCTRRSSWANSG